MDKRALERRLSALAGFERPDVEREQYPTPAWLAAHLVHLADLRDDLAGATVVDLGTGTGVLALAAATRGPERVVAVEVDRSALRVARGNEATVDPPVAVDWIQGDARDPPLAIDGPVTVLMNPPFGAQRGHRHADRAFLAAAAALATTSYSIHNAGSEAFVSAFAGDNGGTVTDAAAAELSLARQFDFHEAASETVPVEVFRIEWPGAGQSS